MPKPSHPFSEIAGNLHGVGKGGAGWSEDKRETLHMQNKSVDGSSLLGHYGMNYIPVHAT